MIRLKCIFLLCCAVFVACLCVLPAPAFSAEEVDTGPVSYRGKGKRMKSMPDWPNNIQFLSGPTGGQWFQLGENIARLLNKEIIPTSSRLGGGLSNLINVNNKTGDVGFSVTSFLHCADVGLPEFAGVNVDNISIIGEMYPQLYYFIVREDFARKHNLKTVRDLLNLKQPGSMASLRPGSASYFVVSLLLKYGYKTGFEQLKDMGWRLSYGNFTVLTDEFVSGEIDALVFTAGKDVSLVHSIVEYVPVRFLPIDANVVELFAKDFGMFPHTIPKGTYKKMTEDVVTLGDNTNIIIRRDLPEELAFAITRITHEYRHVIGADISDFLDWKPALTSRFAHFFHPGAKRYWQALSDGKKE